MTFTLGAHNLHDEAGVPTFFADVIVFTEAIPKGIRARARARWAHTQGRLAGYRIVTCHAQPDLVVAVRRRLFKVTAVSYTRYVDGVRKVTPNRGTFIVFATHRPTGKPWGIPAEHRINAWHPSQPDRGERAFRASAWRRHTAGTIRTLIRLKDSGFEIAGGGDTNTPKNVPAYADDFHEAGTSLDRVVSTCPIGDVEYLHNQGSDHPRLRVTVHT